ncbi:MAG: amino acid adenylation domain-containing protein, partial [Pyrinomonadaceae bacterium]
LVFEGGQLTYGELNARANQLARLMRRRGVGTDAPIALLLGRSEEQMLALLAVLKAGGGYLPLDPALPSRRIALLLEDARPRLIVTHRRLLDVLPPEHAEVVCLDAERDALAREDTSDLRGESSPESLAYVLYTSGSTGRPKGVAMPHRPLVNLMHWQLGHAAAGASARTVQFAPLSFDVSCQEIFSTWCGGGALVLVSDEVRRDPAAFWRLLSEEAVERLFVPFVYLQQLAEAMPTALEAGGAPAAAVRLREVLTAGEQLQVTPALVEMFRRLPGGVLVNQYGPTEAHVVSAHSLGGAPTRWPLLPPIGRPVSNARLYVLDAHGRPVPVGVSGELHIGGACVARGYLNRPGLTAEKFVPDPFSDEPGARLYRTGDVARLTADGEIEYVGRADEQVKIRGFRVELGEVEAALASHAGVRACAATVRGEGAAGKRLVAYVVADAEQTASAAELRGHIKERVPEYMVPSAFVFLDELPLTASGKVNRRALPEPDAARPEQGKSHVAPRTPTEETLARIWAEVLGLEQVGVHDNFFELGGDSILTIQVVARANQAGLRLIPRQLFQSQTIAKLAAVAGTGSGVEAEQGIVTGDVPLTPIQHWLFEQRLPAPHHFNMGYLFELRQEVDERVLREGVRALYEHHDALRMRFVREGDGWRQFDAAPDDRVPFSRFDLAGMDEDEQRRAVESEAARLQASLDLNDGPLVRVALFERGEGRTARLLFVAHHLVVDGVSWRVLLADLQTACEQLRGGQPVRLPAKTTSYKHWAERLSEHARSEAARAELDYWLSEHGGTAASLPIDFAGGERLESSSDIVAVALDVEETEALLREVPKFRRLRINDILLAALARSFSRWTGGPLLLELEGHGREEVVEGVDVSRTVGWFTSIFPVRLDLGDSATPGEVLQTVRERLERVPHAGVGYGVLRYLGGEDAAAKLASLPRAEVSFNYLGQADQSFGENSLLRLAEESAGPTAGPETAMPHLLYVAGIVFQGRLNVRFKYSKNVHRTETVGALAQSYVEELRALIAYCREAGAAEAEAGEAPRAFPLAPLGGKELEAALSHVEFAREGGGRNAARDNVADVYPLSPAQEGILFHSIYAPESGVYVVQIHCSLHAPEVRAVERAWQAVVDRNPILRTAFVWENVARPLQVVGRGVAVPWQRLDWRDASPEEQAERFNRYLEDERARGFELTQAPLMRMGMIRVADDEYKFVWNHHHLLLDGWSIFLVLKELFTFYDSFALNVAAEVEPTRPFGEYIEWLQSRDPVEVEEFWRRALKGFDSPTPVGREMSDAVREGEERHGELRLVMSEADSEAVRALARQHRLTVNTVVQGAWALLLGHTGGRHDVAFGATASGRPAELPGIETMVGMFINVLPMRVRLPDEEPLAAWLEGIQTAQFEVRQYEYSPLVQVQRFSGVPRGTPLFESILSFENYPVDNSIREYTRSLNLTDVYNVSRTNYPLTIIVAPRSEQMALRFVYDRRRFDGASAAHLASQFQTLLREFAARPDATLGELRQALARADEGQRLVGQGRAEESKRARFKAVKPKAVSLPSEPVRTAPLSAASPLPLVVEPATADADLAGWAAHNRELIERRLGEHGALLLRGFPVDSVDKFEQVAAAVCPRLFGEYGDLPREGEGGKVYGSTPYPADQSILFHNESSHLHRWPMKIFFYCVRAAQTGGETPVVDCREVYKLLPRAVAARFAEKGLMYVRNFIEGLDISWQTFYGTDDRRVVEARCRESGTGFEWRGENSLRTRRVCPAVARHPRTGETVFFNQVQLHHVSCLEQSVRETLLSMYRGDELPRNVYYGDGSPIEDSVVAEVVETYRRAAVSFPWREGDILMLDNMLTAHARNPYTGTRKIVVAMGEMTDGDPATPNGGA